MMLNEMPLKCWMIFFILGCFSWTNAICATQIESVDVENSGKPFIFKKKSVLSAATYNAESEVAGRFSNNFDRVANIIEAQKNSISTFISDWLNVSIDHRTRYEVYDNGFTRNIPGSNDQIHQRTRFLFEVKNILDPLQFTLELTDMRASMSQHGQGSSNVFANHFDFTQLHFDLVSKDFLGTGYAANFEVGRMVMDFGQGRLIAGHRWGPLTPTFDGIQLTLGSDLEGWGLRAFGTRPVNRKPTKLDWNTPETYFSGIQITNRDLRWAQSEWYFFELNEGNKGRKRDISTTGFRLFSNPEKGFMDYEIESMYQFGEVGSTNYFAHRHHGEVGYSFNTKMPFRFTYLFDYSSGNRDPNKNFDFLFAKRRSEYGPSSTLGIFFPSNIISPVGFRATLKPVSTVILMMSHRAFWLANKRGSFVGSGLQDATGRSGGYLGSLFDLNLKWDPQASYWRHMSFDVGYTHLFKGSFFDKVPQSPGSTDTNYGYTMVTYAF